MRVIGGKARGRILQFPSSSKERPTSDFLREALFNLLGPLEEKSFLDLFAGSGSVGIEAASRGAKEIVFIEKDGKIATVAQKNVVACNLDKSCRIIARDIGAGLCDLFKNKYEFDVVFADPPYCRGLVEKTIKLLKENPVFTEEAVVVIQHSTREDMESLLDEKTILKDQRKYGDNALTFLKMERP
ncbi:MAG: 16S rRNA (guanine(966)-N(2))-methyltransferase RsmD [Smithellaceae bacterium]